MRTFLFSLKTNFPLWVKLHAPTLPIIANCDLIVIREFSFLENVARYKREIHFELRKTSSLREHVQILVGNPINEN